MDSTLQDADLLVEMGKLQTQMRAVSDIIAARAAERKATWGISVDSNLSAAAFAFSRAVKTFTEHSKPRDPDKRRGDWITVYSGGRFWVLDPRPEDVDPRDIAHSLADKPRWNSHTFIRVTVGAHSLRVRAIAMRMARDFGMSEEQIALVGFYAVLHDAEEAYLADICTPLKRALPEWADIADRVQNAILAHFHLPPMTAETAAIVEAADKFSLFLEARDAFPKSRVDEFVRLRDLAYKPEWEAAAMSVGESEPDPETVEHTLNELFSTIHAVTSVAQELPDNVRLLPPPSSTSSWRQQVPVVDIAAADVAGGGLDDEMRREIMSKFGG